MASLIFLLVAVTIGLDTTDGHGYMMRPPMRSHKWRVYPGLGLPPNYQENEVFCGGRLIDTNEELKSVCGVCGDRITASVPRPHEIGGIYGDGMIVATYKEGQDLEVMVRLTANHMGWFEFQICPLSSLGARATHQCFEDHPLKIKRVALDSQSDTVALDGVIDQFTFRDRHIKDFYITLQVPNGITCSNCVLRWHYKAAQHNNECGLACGKQEHYINCADIAITKNDDPGATTGKPGAATTTSVTSGDNDAGTTKSPTTADNRVTERTTTVKQSTRSTAPTGSVDPCNRPDQRLFAGLKCDLRCRVDCKDMVGTFYERLADWCVLNCGHKPSFCPFFCHCQCVIR